MKNIFALSAAFLLSLSLPSAFGQEQSPAPEYRDGDSWQFNAIEKGQVTSSTRAMNGDFKVTFRGGEVRVAPVGQEKSGMKQSTGELRRMLAINDELKYLEFPLSVNKKWSAEFEDELRRGATVRSQADMNVVGYEEVTTAAGKFKAFKIERYETSSTPGKGRSGNTARHVEYIYFYSPDTRSIVKFHRDDTHSGSTRDVELIKYTPVK